MEACSGASDKKVCGFWKYRLLITYVIARQISAIGIFYIGTKVAARSLNSTLVHSARSFINQSSAGTLTEAVFERRSPLRFLL
jgi:hypothetical protein